MIIEYIKAIIFGLAEGVTEWLPISSTGHLILLGDLVSLDLCEGELAKQYRALFDVVIQLGAILAVLVLYRQKLMPTTHQGRALWLRLAVATLPAATVGLAADALCEHCFNRSLDELLFTPYVVASALITYGILFIIVERLTPTNTCPQCYGDSISIRRALAIGCFQTLALVPGTSRSGATILGARILNTSRSAAAEFSFFAAIPVIAAASALKIFDFVQFTSDTGAQVTSHMIGVLMLAATVAFVTSLGVIKFLTGFIKQHSFALFGIYRVVLGVAVFILL